MICNELALSVFGAMSGDNSENRENLNVANLCMGFWSVTWLSEVWWPSLKTTLALWMMGCDPPRGAGFIKVRFFRYGFLVRLPRCVFLVQVPTEQPTAHHGAVFRDDSWKLWLAMPVSLGTGGPAA